MKDKKILTLNEVKQFLFKKNLVIKKKNKSFKIYNFRSIYLTSISSILVIGCFILLPIVINFKTNYII